MNSWAKFLDSLGSRGGNIFILLMSTTGLFIAAVHILHHGDKGDIATVIMSTFSGFSGALLNALVSGGKSASDQLHLTLEGTPDANKTLGKSPEQL